MAKNKRPTQPPQRARVCDMLHTMHLGRMMLSLQKQWDNPDFTDLPFEVRFAQIVQDEYDGRAQSRRERLLREAKLTIPYATFENLSRDSDRGIDYSCLDELKELNWMKADYHPSLLITGATGTGKTFLAQCFGNAACNASLSTQYIRTPQLLECFEDANRNGNAAKYRKQLCGYKVLIIDDFAMSPLSEEMSRDLLSLLTCREHESTTIIASQVDIAQWHDCIKNAWDADAIIDRLIGGSYKISLTGESRRMRK